ncbi:alpha/beta hydrolase [Niastella vici]|uniref:Alpha/beta hydrolase n=1 Tax=Niastella vici TaxID=1703345 RepID=A0A1V9FQC4_9BACT|nr:alpha/beta hydrolase [Niastella vici]
MTGYSQNVAGKTVQSLSLKATTQFAIVNHHKVAYRKFGSGVPLIMANRFRGTLDTWDPLFLDLLAKQNTVITFDYSGIGYSEGELPLTMQDLSAEVISLADYLKIDKFNMLGWSYGGWIAQYVTFLYPSRIAKTVVIDANAMGKNEIPMDPAFAKSGMKPNKELQLEDYVILFFEPKSEKSREAARKSIERISKRLDESKVPEKPEVLQRYFAPNAAVVEDKENFRAAYATLRTSVMVISGDHDISFAVDNWYPLVRKAPTMQLIVFPDAGHGPQHQYPELAAGYISTFLKN